MPLLPLSLPLPEVLGVLLAVALVAPAFFTQGGDASSAADDSR